MNDHRILYIPVLTVAHGGRKFDHLIGMSVAILVYTTVYILYCLCIVQGAENIVAIATIAGFSYSLSNGFSNNLLRRFSMTTLNLSVTFTIILTAEL